MASALVAGQVSVEPSEFTQVSYDAAEIAALVTELAERLEVSNTISLVIDETTPLAKITSSMDAATSDATIIINAQSGSIENTKHLQTFGPRQATVSIGRMLLRARDRQRSDFADVPGDDELTREQHAAWDSYCAGRLAQAGYEVNQQRWRYNHRNRFGFNDAVDADFDRLWAADDLAWADIVAEI